jgi:hypothetical protein
MSHAATKVVQDLPNLIKNRSKKEALHSGHYNTCGSCMKRRAQIKLAAAAARRKQLFYLDLLKLYGTWWRLLEIDLPWEASNRSDKKLVIAHGRTESTFSTLISVDSTEALPWSRIAAMTAAGPMRLGETVAYGFYSFLLFFTEGDRRGGASRASGGT